MEGTSPSRANFSYPNRGGMPSVQAQQQQQSHQSTLQGLKAAAVGIHVCFALSFSFHPPPSPIHLDNELHMLCIC